MSFSRAAAMPVRIRPNVRHALGGIWRLTVRRFSSLNHWLMLAGMLALLVVFSLPAAPNREAAAQSYLPWAAGFYVCFLVPILAFLSAGGIMRDDLGAASVDYIFTRPVRRPVWIGLRYLAHIVCAQVNHLLALLTLIAVGIYRDVPQLWAAVPILLAGQVLALVAFSALGFLCAMATSRYVIVGLVYGAIIEAALGNTPTQLNRISMVRHLIGVVQPVLGDFRVGMGGPLAVEPLSAAASSLVLLCVAAAIITLTALLFTIRELDGGSARDA